MQHNQLSTTLRLSPGLFFPAVIIFRLIISRHIATPLNYRMTVSGRSDFPVYQNFPEVYHGGEISKVAFSGVQHPVIRDMIKHNIWGIASTGKRR